LDFSEVYGQTPEMLKNSLNQRLKDVAFENKIHLDADPYPPETFIRLIRSMNRGKGVVVLIDEYDQPILKQMANRIVSLENQEILHDFFSVIKSQGKNIRFAFVTGVSKFAKVSLFSGMNNLDDLTLQDHYSSIAGITEKEIDQVYMPYVKSVAKRRGKTVEVVRKEMRKWYNGYCFSRTNQEARLYNPISLHQFLSQGDLTNYWFTTATPTFALKLIRERNYPVQTLEKGAEIGLRLEENHDSEQIDLITLLFQTGYLTISSYDEPSQTFVLNFPNEEVRQSFYNHLSREFIGMESSLIRPILKELKQHIHMRNWDDFFQGINQILSEIPYTIQVPNEAYYHTLIFLILRQLDLTTEAEVLTNRGRLDLVLFLEQYIVIFELKIDSSAEKALKQIREKGYSDKYQNKGQELLLIGVNIDSKKRLISEWKLTPN